MPLTDYLHGFLRWALTKVLFAYYVDWMTREHRVMWIAFEL